MITIIMVDRCQGLDSHWVYATQPRTHPFSNFRMITYIMDLQFQ